MFAHERHMKGTYEGDAGRPLTFVALLGAPPLELPGLFFDWRAGVRAAGEADRLDPLTAP